MYEQIIIKLTKIRRSHILSHKRITVRKTKTQKHMTTGHISAAAARASNSHAQGKSFVSDVRPI